MTRAKLTKKQLQQVFTDTIKREVSVRSVMQGKKILHGIAKKVKEQEPRK